MKFSGKNFQAWGEFDLDVTGLTVLTGPSDTGKSALMRALRGLFYNDLSEAYIREGSSGLELTVDWDGDTIKVTRAVEESTKYEITKQGEAPKKFAKLASRRPEELRAFGVNDIRIGDTTLDPIFAIQNDTQFLLQGVSISELNNILGGFASTEKLEYGKREANLRIQQKNAEARTLAVEVHDAEVRRAAFEQKVEVTAPLVSMLEQLEPLVWRLEEQSLNVQAALHYKRQLTPLREILAKLELPDLTNAERQSECEKAIISATAAKREVRNLRGIQTKVEDAVGLWSQTKKVFFAQQAASELVGLKQIRSRMKALAKGLDVVAQIDLTAPERLIESIKIVGDVTAIRARLVKLREEQTAISVELDLATKASHDLIAHQPTTTRKLTKCPECGAEF